MNKRILMAGISAAAFATGVANAQDSNGHNTNSVQNNGNASNAACISSDGNNGNNCTIVQNGRYDGATVYENAWNSTGTVTQSGDSNTALTYLGGSANLANPSVPNAGRPLNGTRANGLNQNNSASVVQSGSLGYALTDQTGAFNTASTTQSGSSIAFFGPHGLAVDDSTIVQSGFIGSPSFPGGTGNTAGGNAVGGMATVVQSGNVDSSSIVQNYSALASSQNVRAPQMKSASVNQSSDYEASTIRQTSALGGGSATVVQSGVNETATILQSDANASYYGALDGGSSGRTLGGLSSANINQSGNSAVNSVGDYARIRQPGIYDTGSITQASSLSSATIDQVYRASATITQSSGLGGSNLLASVSQNYGGTSANPSTGGGVASVTQSGTNSTATVNQDAAEVANATVNEAGRANFSRVTQSGSLASKSALTPGSASGNTASVDLQNAQTTGTYTGHSSTVDQTGTGNSATVYLYGGNGGPQGSTSTNGGPPTPSGAPAAALGQSSTVTQSGDNNGAFVSITEGTSKTPTNGDVSSISQTGRGNYAETTITGGINAVSTEEDGTSRSGVNTATITQTNGTNIAANAGGSSTAVITVNGAYGSVTPINGEPLGIGNVATVTQTALADPGRGPGSRVSGSTGVGEVANFSGSRGLLALVRQQGQYGTVAVSQADSTSTVLHYDQYGVLLPANAPQADTDVYGRARTNVAQAGEFMSASVTQNGDNYAEVTQGAMNGSTTTGTSGTVTINQTDAGDAVTTQSTFLTNTTTDPLGHTTTTGTAVPAGTTVRQYNRVVATQYGDNNRMNAVQNTRAGYMALYQRQDGTGGNLIDAQQGTGQSGIYNPSTQAPAVSPLSPTASTPTGTNTDNSSVTIVQAGGYNGVRVYQDGTVLTANVTQLGTGNGPIVDGIGAGQSFSGAAVAGNTSANGRTGNVVVIAQQGSNNLANALQGAGVGASAAGDPASGNAAGPDSVYYFSGGSRSPELEILQGGSQNAAYAEQQGRGQYARIEQSGSFNTAAILQEAGATNATAIIRQSGDHNTYYIDEVDPGQYISVTQTGSYNNAGMTTVVGPTVPPTGGASGSQLPPAFGPAPGGNGLPAATAGR